MQEFTNTAIDEINTECDKKCVYYGECYLQVRNGGLCATCCKDIRCVGISVSAEEASSVTVQY